jgi:hypothetical protein
MQRIAGVVLLGLVACQRPVARVDEREPPRLDAERPLFEQLRGAGGFSRDAYVVWSPIWPTAGQEVTILYDTRAELAPLRGSEPIEWFLQPEKGDTIWRPTISGSSGIAALHEPVSGLQPGWFGFRRGERRDNDCDNPWKLAVVAEAPRWQEATSEHFRYRWLPGDPVAERVQAVLASLEAHLSRLVQGLGLEVPVERVVFLHYATRDIGFEYQAHHGNNADEFRHLVFSAERPDDSHELTHLLVNEQWGRHHAGLFDEGVAVHFGQEVAEGTGWRGRPCDAWTRESIERGDLPPLTSIATTSAFYDRPADVVGDVFYPAGCSFVRDLVERYGASRLRTLLTTLTCGNQSDAAAVARLFQDAFGVSLAAADSAWRAKLKGLSRPATSSERGTLNGPARPL